MVTRPDWTGGSFGGVPVKPQPDTTAAAARATATPTDRVFIECLRLIPGYPEGGITQRAPDTRGQGFTDGEPNQDIRAVILTAAARLLSNPRGLLMDETKGPESVSYRSAFTGWTVAELFVLNRYRVTAR